MEKKSSKRKKSQKRSSEASKKVVFPGQIIPTDSEKTTRVGRGLLVKENSLIASRCGILIEKKNGKLDVESKVRFYIPETEDVVIGVVVEKHAESYRLEIGTTHPARLNTLAFEGASKRNRPNIAVGALVYCRVEVADKDIETELTCISQYIKKDWVTGESLYGELKEGHQFKCSLPLARKLFLGTAAVLAELEKHGIPFEIAAGVNGYVWVRSESPLNTIVIVNAIQNSDGMEHSAMTQMVAQLVRVAKSREQ